MKRFTEFVHKEFLQIFRDSRTMLILLVMPVVLVVLFGYAITTEVNNTRMAVFDMAKSQTSQQLIQRFDANSYFHIETVVDDYDALMPLFRSGKIDMVLCIDADDNVQMLFDGIEPNQANMRSGYAMGIKNSSFINNHLLYNPQSKSEYNFVPAIIGMIVMLLCTLMTSYERTGEGRIMISANAVNAVKAGLGQVYLQQIISDMPSSSFRFLFNPHLDYKLYMVPAIISLLLILTVGFLPALNIVGEKEKGTIEQINVTPIGRFEFIFSKMIPYWCVGILILFIAMGAARLIHGIAPSGSILTILVMTSLFILVVSCLGFIVSNYSDTIQQAALVMFFFLVIFLLLSGLLTPVASMPHWAHVITEFNPMRYYIEPMRMIYIKGSGLHDLLPYLLRLVLMAVVTWTWAIISYRKSS